MRPRACQAVEGKSIPLGDSGLVAHRGGGATGSVGWSLGKEEIAEIRTKDKAGRNK